MSYEDTLQYRNLGAGGPNPTSNGAIVNTTNNYPSGTLTEANDNTLTYGETFDLAGVTLTYYAQGTAQGQVYSSGGYGGSSWENTGPQVTVVIAQNAATGEWYVLFPNGAVASNATRMVLTNQSTGNYSVGGAVVCFAAGTLIKTIDGERSVEQIEIGDLVLTVDASYQEVKWIGSTSLGQGGKLPLPMMLCPIRIPQGALGMGLPTKTLIVSPQHRLLVCSPFVERMTGASEALIAAKHLVGISGIHVATDLSEIEYWHILFDQHQLVWSNGAPSESLFTGPQALEAVPPEAKIEILALFPQLADDASDGLSDQSIRTIIPSKKSKHLAMRHIRNNKPLLVGDNNWQKTATRDANT